MFLSYLKWMGIGIALTIGTIVTIGPIYQYISTQIDKYNYQPIGQMIDIGGYKLHLHYTHVREGPTVVLEAGAGCSGIFWTMIQSQVSEFATVCSYDRAGYGWSEKSSNQRTSKNMVQELHTLLENANVPKPYIMVGHSLGGGNVQLYTSIYPNDVVGVILIEAIDGNYFAQVPQVPMPSHGLVKTIRFMGVDRLINTFKSILPLPELFPKDAAKIFAAHNFSYKHLNTALQELGQVETSCQQIKDSENKLTDKVLTVISAGKDPDLKFLPKDYDIKRAIQSQKELQENLVKKSKYGKQIIAEDSGHNIPLEQPEIIVEEIRKMITYLNNNKKQI